MVQDATSYFVVTLDEMRRGDTGPNSYIPTFGAATSAVDQYRTVAVAESNLAELGAAFVDIESVSSISKIAEGGLSSFGEIEAAESALQALMLHDIVHVILPSPKVRFENGLVSYIRLDRDRRSDFGFDLFRLADSRDWLVAPEFACVEDGKIANSTYDDSALVGMSVDRISKLNGCWDSQAANALNVSIEMHGIPAYLTDPGLVRSRRGDGFAKRFYHHLGISWEKAVGNSVPIVCTFSIPPLLSIVMHRMGSRYHLKQTISDLRQELSIVRVELKELNNIVTSSVTQASIDRQIKHITESFDAIVPESRLSGAQRRRRKISTVQRLVRPILKFAAGFVMNNGASLEDVLSSVRGVASRVEENYAIVDRTVTSRTFSGLLRETESLQSLVKYHFSDAEINAIEASLRK